MLNKTISKLRKAHGLTQAKFAEAIHVTQAAVSQWETGKTCPDVQQMFIIADFFGVTVEELSSGSVQNHAPVPKENAPADMRAEAKQLLEGMTEEQYQAALQYLKFLQSQK